MGMSGPEIRRIRSELGLIPGEPCTAGAFYKIPSGWLREILHESAHLNKEMHKFWERAGELSKRVIELEAHIRALEAGASKTDQPEDWE